MAVVDDAMGRSSEVWWAVGGPGGGGLGVWVAENGGWLVLGKERVLLVVATLRSCWAMRGRPGEGPRSQEGGGDALLGAGRKRLRGRMARVSVNGFFLFQG